MPTAAPAWNTISAPSRREPRGRRFSRPACVRSPLVSTSTACRTSRCGRRRNPPTRRIFSFFRSDVREAKRLFCQRWRGGPRPKASEWAAELHAAADVLAEQDAFGADTTRAALGDQRDPRKVPLRQIARASKWQDDVVSTFSTARREAANLRTALITLSAAQVAQLAALATPARALLGFLDQQSPPDRAPWSALRSRAVSRAAALTKLAEAQGVRPAGWPAHRRARGVAAAHTEWLAANEALASDRARAVAGAVPTETLRVTADFAQDIWSRHHDLGLFFLTDGWSNHIATLRQCAGDAKNAAEVASGILDDDEGRLAKLRQRGASPGCRGRPDGGLRHAGRESTPSRLTWTSR